jgi:aminopeptidase YwaD
MSFQSNNEVITGFFETNETTHKHTATDLLVNMDPVYNYKVAKATIGATMHFATASTSALNDPNFEADNQVSIFPNPTYDFITINKGILTDSNYTFSLVDIYGKTVLTQNITSASLLENINVSQLSSGVYLGIIETQTNRITKKIVIE